MKAASVLGERAPPGDGMVRNGVFLPSSYGFRPGRGRKDALRDVDRLVRKGCTYVVDADLRSYFDSIPHDRSMERVESRVSNGRVLALLQGWLDQDVPHGSEGGERRNPSRPLSRASTSL